MTLDLSGYDVLLVNTSGGKDSQAMLDEVYRQAYQQGVAPRLVAVHADLGKMEWTGTRELAQEQVEHYGIRFEVVSRRTKEGKRQDLLEQIEARGMFPDSARRYCTSDQKRGPVLTLVTLLVAELRLGVSGRESGLKGPIRVLNMMGLRGQESATRALRPTFSHNERATNGRRIVDEWLPIHHWTEDQVWERIKASGVRHHPAYDLGMPRLSCRFCILASRSALVLSAQHNPELAAEYVAVEERIGHRFRKDLSMGEIVALAASTPMVQDVESWAA